MPVMSVINKIDILISVFDDVEKQSVNIPPDKLHSLTTFNIEEDLVQTEDYLAFKGNFGDIQKPAILKLRPSKPKASELKQSMNSMKLSLVKQFGKGYGFYKAKCESTKSFSIDVIYPWIEPDDDDKEESEEEKKQRLVDQQKKFDKHYQRALPKKRYLVRETAEMYEKIQLPYIQSIPTADIQWVYDVLDGKRETKAVVATDEDEELGFVTVPDSKWKSHPKVDKVPREEWKLNEQVSQSLYVLSLVRDRSIKSLRDLRGKHVKLLENLMVKTMDGIKETYGLDKNELRVFVHYPPQYWHFHIHFTCLAIDYGIHAGHAILLEDVIDNLKMDSDYYQKASISSLVFEGDHLLQSENADDKVEE